MIVLELVGRCRCWWHVSVLELELVGVLVSVSELVACVSIGVSVGIGGMCQCRYRR